ncbi:MAG TPA: efflux RND transporter periplasmic adaptor subunit [Gammaproteobacteria bacterium]|nr:efflux RND transporter periplasmic adaptor subunit [Gammaproteobacteria bacterium]
MKRFRGRHGAAVAGGIVAAAAVAAILLLGYLPGGRTEEAAEAAPAAHQASLTVTTVKVQPRELTHTIAVDGAIFPWQEVIISPEVGGYRVAEVNVDVGDRVKKGQELVRLSAGLLEAEVASKEAVLKQREAELVNAQASLKRGQSLAVMEALSKSDLDQLDSTEQAAAAQVQSAKADLEASKLKLKYTHVTAPDDGIITSRTVTLGQVAQAGSELLRLLRQDRVEWRGQVPEALLSELARGQTVTISTPDGSTYEGKIRVVAPTVADQTRTGLVYVDLPVDPRLRPGMFSRGKIQTGQGQGLTLPLESVVSNDGYSYAFVLHPDHTVERRRIETGAVLGSAIEVTDGLSTGELIVDKGAGFLKDGDLVSVAKEADSLAERNAPKETNGS